MENLILFFHFCVMICIFWHWWHNCSHDLHHFCINAKRGYIVWCYIISLLFHLPSWALSLLISLHFFIPWWFLKKKQILAFICLGISCCNHFTLLGSWSIVVLHQIIWTCFYVYILFKFSFFKPSTPFFLLQAYIVLVELDLLHHFALNLFHNVLF